MIFAYTLFRWNLYKHCFSSNSSLLTFKRSTESRKSISKSNRSRSLLSSTNKIVMFNISTSQRNSSKQKISNILEKVSNSIKKIQSKLATNSKTCSKSSSYSRIKPIRSIKSTSNKKLILIKSKTRGVIESLVLN